jgi:hypothetical protein
MCLGSGRAGTGSTWADACKHDLGLGRPQCPEHRAEPNAWPIEHDDTELESLQRENRRLRDQLDASAGHTAAECEADAIQAEYDALQKRARRVEAAARRATTSNDTSTALVELETVLDEGAAMTAVPADGEDEGRAWPEATT